LIGDAFLFLGV